jgi:filamentous hemagglutinin
MTQSSVITERGGDITLRNPGGAINVGLKETTQVGNKRATGVIALGGGSVFGLAQRDFQVNTQRVFIVGSGNMTIWSSLGDIDSGRGANTAVAAPPLAPRRSADGVVFETAATTTGSGLGILPDTQGRSAGTIGLYPALGEILALDAFIRAPSVVLGSSVRGADNLVSAAVSGAAATVSAPPAAVPPAPAGNESRSAAGTVAEAAAQARQRNSLLTVELLGLGPADGGEPPCSEADRRVGKCRQPAAP